MPAFPRTKKPYRATKPKGRAGLITRSQRGVSQGRSTTARGVRWSEQWRTLRVGDPDVEALLEFVRRHRRLTTVLDVDHLQVKGSGLAPNGLGEENLLRDAAMDADTDADGVVDGFSVRVQNTGWTFALDATAGAQRIDYDGVGGGSQADVTQFVLRVFEGDEITLSADARIDAASVMGVLRFQVFAADGSSLGFPSGQNFTNTSFQRVVHTLTVPDDVAFVRVLLLGQRVDDSSAGSVYFRDVRLLRASSDPTPWANPHVDGASQTGTSLATAGWPASITNVVRQGDMIRIGGSGETKAAAEADVHGAAYWVTADADSDASGLATLQIEPSLLTAPPDGAALRLTGSRIPCRIVGHQIPEAGPGEYLDGMRVDFEEAP